MRRVHLRLEQTYHGVESLPRDKDAIVTQSEPAQNQGVQPGETIPSGAGGEDDGSSLCLACGLCCGGFLHADAAIDRHEITLLNELGLKVEKYGDHLGWSLPCPLHQAGRCSVYPHRPNVCGAYRCALLRRYLAHEISLDQSLGTVQTARELIDQVVQQMPEGTSFHDLKRELVKAQNDWSVLFTSSEARRDAAQLMLKVVTLNKFLEKHFIARTQDK